MVILFVLSSVLSSSFGQGWKAGLKKASQGGAYAASVLSDNNTYTPPSHISIALSNVAQQEEFKGVLLQESELLKRPPLPNAVVDLKGKEPVKDQRKKYQRKLEIIKEAMSSRAPFSRTAHLAYLDMALENEVRMDSVLILIKDIKTGTIVGSFCKKEGDNNHLIDWKSPLYSFPTVMRAATYITALENGGSPDSIVDTRMGVYVDVKGDTVRDHNYKRGGYGIMTLQRGLMVNSDVAEVQSLEKFLPDGYATLEASLNKMGLRHQGIITSYQTMCQARMSPAEMLDWMTNVAKGHVPGVSSENVKALQQALLLHVEEGLGKKAKSNMVKSCGISYVTLTDDSSNYELSFLGYFPYEKPLYSVYVEMYKDGKPATSSFAAEVFRIITDLLTLRQNNINNTQNE